MISLAITPMIFAFLAPLLGALGSTFIGQAIVGTAVSLGLGYLARKLQPQPDTTVRGMSLSLQTDSNDDRQVAFGRCLSAGSLKYHNTYGPNKNDYLQLIIQLADHECDGLEAVFVDGVQKSILGDASTGLVTGNAVQGYSGAMWVKFYSGAWSQAADPDIVARSPGAEWTSDDRGRGICYVRVTLKADPKKFKTGLPELAFLFRGAKLYDPRKDPSAGGVGSHAWGNEATYEWSDNVAVCAYNYLRGIRVNGTLLAGVNCPASSLPASSWISQANKCDELVALKAGGTEKRYRMGGVVDVSTDPRAVLREMLGACAGDLIDSGGIFRLNVGAAQSSVLTITDADIMAEGDVEISPKASRSSIVNAVYGSFSDPLQGYQSASLPPRISPADQLADGGAEWAEHYNLAFVTSQTQGQRILEIFRRRARYQRRISLPLRSRFATLEAGDWVTLNSGRYGITGGLFEVVQCQLGRDLVAAVELAEVATSIFAWTPGLDELDPQTPRQVDAGGSTFTSITGLTLANVTVSSDTAEISRPGLQATWDAITDPSVIGMVIEYRRLGDDVALRKEVLDREAVAFTWVDGVQGATVYEARIMPRVLPERAVDWSPWVSAATATGQQIVAQAAEALYIDPANIPPAELGEQEARELELSFRAAQAVGYLGDRVRDLASQIEQAAEAAIKASISSGEAHASIQEEIKRRQTDAGLVLEQINTLSGSLSGQSVSIVQLNQVIAGLNAQWAVAVTGNNQVRGLVRLDGSLTESEFTVVADRFRVALPDELGGDAVPIFAIGRVNGQPQLTLVGDLLADGFIQARHLQVSTLSAISADLGTIRAGLIMDSTGALRFDLANMRLSRTENGVETMVLDFKAKRFRMVF